MKLIINADDFGLSKQTTDGIIDAFKCGAITSTTIMSNMEWADYAIEQAKKNGIKSVGLHVNLTEGKPLTKCPTLCDKHGNFNVLEKYESKELCEKEIYNEIIAQKNHVEKQGLKITHMDRHHQPELNPIFAKVFLKIVKEFNLPMRRFKGVESPESIITPDVWDRAMYSMGSSNDITVDKFKEEIRKYIDTGKTVEVHCHPAYLDEHTTQQRNRPKELQILKDSKSQGVFNGIKMIDYIDLKKD